MFVPFFIVSGALEGSTPIESQSRTQSLENWLRGLGYATAPVRSCYKGQEEPAILVIDDAQTAGHDVLRLARQYGRESVLHVDANRQATLHYLTYSAPVFESLGTWRSAPEAKARARDAWAERGGYFYVVDPVPCS